MCHQREIQLNKYHILRKQTLNKFANNCVRKKIFIYIRINSYLNDNYTNISQSQNKYVFSNITCYFKVISLYK